MEDTSERGMSPHEVADVVFDAIQKSSSIFFPIPNRSKRSNCEQTNCSAWIIRKARQ